MGGQQPQQQRATKKADAKAPAALSTETALPTLGLDKQAFSSVVNKALPLSPQQILELHTLFNKTQHASTTDPGIPPRPVSRMLQVSLSPGATPPIIRESLGYVSVVGFLDKSGQPWPIEAYDIGNPNAYGIQWNQKDNLLMIQGLTQGKVANLMVKLRGLSTPVMMTLVSSQKAVDYRVDVRVPGMGPNMKTSVSGDALLPSAANPVLMNVLNGIGPDQSKNLSVSRSDSEAWLSKGKMFLRTPARVISPGWLASMASADGTTAYELQKTPLVLVSDQGKTMQLKITGFE